MRLTITLCTLSAIALAATAPSVALSRAGIAARGAATGVLLVSNYTGSRVTIYDAASKTNPPPLGQIRNGLFGPQGLATDASGNLYVADANEFWIDRYANGSKTRSARLLTGRDQCPVDVAAGSDGTVYAAVEYCGVKPLIWGYLEEFAPGSLTPTLKIRVPGAFPMSVTLDASGNTYLGETNNSNVSRILRFAPGSTHGVDVGIRGIRWVGGMGFDSKANFYVVDMLNALINVYSRGSTTPWYTITSGLTFPRYLALASDDTLYVADANANEVLEYAPGATTPQATFSKGMNRPIGVALLPSW